jgi:hypothetical protein
LISVTVTTGSGALWLVYSIYDLVRRVLATLVRVRSRTGTVLWLPTILWLTARSPRILRVVTTRRRRRVLTWRWGVLLVLAARRRGVLLMLSSRGGSIAGLLLGVGAVPSVLSLRLCRAVRVGLLTVR